MLLRTLSQAAPAHVGVESLRSSLVAAARLANVAEEAASINHPGNLNPDAAETAPLEEAGQKAKSGLFERLQERQQEIEISCASAMTLIRMEARWRWLLRPQPFRQ
ncbi:hypothetical protein CK203_087747 [Vitis vinifera]|uniref:Uncharacterized protein n=1 Tax=Vitis vinifera TaxID=29760 RepID=A0A438CV98_VITVI|nr:hypothetical protein CK203_087747 [Vitis vinifera]